MSFGSYWNGIYETQLDPITGELLAGAPTTHVAYNSSIEASYLYQHGGYYYLFVNWGTCCDGINSTYNIRVSRNTSPNGPFLDENGFDLSPNNGGPPFPGHRRQVHRPRPNPESSPIPPARGLAQRSLLRRQPTMAIQPTNCNSHTGPPTRGPQSQSPNPLRLGIHFNESSLLKAPALLSHRDYAGLKPSPCSRASLLAPYSVSNS